jgi:hypothetical protein
LITEILDQYNKKLEEQEEICYKNNRGKKEHDYESIICQYIKKNIVETEYLS